MGADKALLDLGGQTAVEWVVNACREGCVDPVIVVRAAGAMPLPSSLRARTVVVSNSSAMIDSLRGGLAALPTATAGCAGALVFPVDYPLVSPATISSVVAELLAGGDLVLPLYSERPGHPIGLAKGLFGEVMAVEGSLRDVVAADKARVRTVPVDGTVPERRSSYF